MLTLQAVSGIDGWNSLPNFVRHHRNHHALLLLGVREDGSDSQYSMLQPDLPKGIMCKNTYYFKYVIKSTISIASHCA